MKKYFHSKHKNESFNDKNYCLKLIKPKKEGPIKMNLEEKKLVSKKDIDAFMLRIENVKVILLKMEKVLAKDNYLEEINTLETQLESVLQKFPDVLRKHIQELIELDKEANMYKIEECSNSSINNDLWNGRLRKDTSWHGYWKNACGLDFALYCNYIKASINYPEDKGDKNLEEWFHSNYPSVKPIPYSIKLANEDFNNFLKK